MKYRFSERVKVLLDVERRGEWKREDEAIFSGSRCFTNSSCHHCSLKAVSEADGVTHTLSLFPSLSPVSLSLSYTNMHTQAPDTLTHIKLVTLKISAHPKIFTELALR